MFDYSFNIFVKLLNEFPYPFVRSHQTYEEWTILMTISCVTTTFSGDPMSSMKNVLGFSCLLHIDENELGGSFVRSQSIPITYSSMSPGLLMTAHYRLQSTWWRLSKSTGVESPKHQIREFLTNDQRTANDETNDFLLLCLYKLKHRNS